MDIYKNLQELDIVLPDVPKKGGVYKPAKVFGEKYVYISGCGPNIDVNYQGKVNERYDLKEASKCAENCALNILSVLEEEIGDLNRVKNVVKLLVFVNSNKSFYEQPKVANGASILLCNIFGENIGLSARSAVSVNVLPNDIPVEIEALFEIE